MNWYKPNARQNPTAIKRKTVDNVEYLASLRYENPMAKNAKVIPRANRTNPRASTLGMAANTITDYLNSVYGIFK